MTPNNAQDETRQVILIDLDVLLDTRLAALIATDTNWASEFLESGGYRNRTSDIWCEHKPGLDMVRYNEIYENRDTELLKAARLTGFMTNLLNIVKHYELDLATRSDMVSDVIIVINTSPYELSPEVEFGIVKAVQQYIGTVVKVRVVSQPHSKLSILYMANKGYTQYVLYDFAKWCNYHFSDENNLSNMTGKFDFGIVAPALLTSQYDEYIKQEVIENQLEDENPFELTKVAFSAMMDLSFLPAHDFSLLDAAKLEAGVPASN